MLMFTHRVCLSLQAMVQQDKSGYSVTLRSASVAPFVWLDVGNIPGRFSSNGFLMLTRNRTVSFTAWRNTSVTELSRSLTITSLRDVYWPETSQPATCRCPVPVCLRYNDLGLTLFQYQKDIFGRELVICANFLNLQTCFLAKQKRR